MFNVGDTIPASLFVPIRGIYLIRNTTNGRVYVGQSVNIQARWATHIVELETDRHGNVDLQADWNEFGASAFVVQIVERVSKRDWLIAVERRWIIACHKKGYDLYNRGTSTEQYIYHAPYHDECAEIKKQGYKKPLIDFEQISPSRGAAGGVARPIPDIAS